MKQKKSFWPDTTLYREDETGIHLLASRCRSCGAITFPQNSICRNCISEDLEEVELSETGILHSWTITRVPVGKFPSPHPIGTISLPADRVRLTAPLVLQDGYRIGAPVRIEPALYWEEDDCEVWGYKFRQLEEEET